MLVLLTLPPSPDLKLRVLMCQVRKKNVLKDFVAVAGPLGVTHFMIFNKTPTSVNMVSPDCCWSSLINCYYIGSNLFSTFRGLLDFLKAQCFTSECLRYVCEEEKKRILWILGLDDDRFIFD